MEDEHLAAEKSSNKQKSEQSHLIEKDENDSAGCSKCCQFPKAIYFIIGCELCERYSYYGIRAILILYLTRYLNMTNDHATAVYHFFIVLCYFTPLFGGFLADNNLGKFKTILILSSVYAVGNAILSLTAIAPPNLAGPAVGLVLIGIGTGGIKPCVSALGGDQIPPSKTELIQSYFAAFYFAINLGSMLSTIITPLLRADVQCFGDDCYPLAFGVPSILMLVALVVFVAGRKLYIQTVPEENVLGKSIKCIIHAIKNYFKQRKTNPKKGGLLEYANDEYNEKFIADIRQAGRIIFLFLPVCMFWALYDQQGSRWTLQATKMDGILFDYFVILPDQMTAANTILMLLLIPLFESVIYPLVKLCGFPDTPLKRMTAGQLLMGFGFLVAFFLQLRIEHNEPKQIITGQSRLQLVNLDDCPIDIRFTKSAKAEKHFDLSAKSYEVRSPSDFDKGTWFINVNFKCDSSGTSSASLSDKISLDDMRAYSLVIWRNGNSLAKNLVPQQEDLENDGEGEVRLMMLKRKPNDLTLGLDLINKIASLSKTFLLNGDQIGQLVVGSTRKTSQGVYELKSVTNSNTSQIFGSYKVLANEIVTFIMVQTNTDHWRIVELIEREGAKISILWQIPQYFVLTIAEILFSISGLNFSYEQAPVSMKSLLSSAWLLSIAVGNIVVMIVAEVHLLPTASWEFFLFFVLSLISTLIFAIFCHFYKAAPKNSESVQLLQKVGDTKEVSVE